MSSYSPRRDSNARCFLPAIKETDYCITPSTFFSIFIFCDDYKTNSFIAGMVPIINILIFDYSFTFTILFNKTYFALLVSGISFSL